tara:strand:- start:149 stop:1084 length:936 start_codon:yes stop_codon:yes gene_type:complete
MRKLKKRILVVLGGNSQERKVSLETGKACINSIRKLGYHVQVFDPANKSFFKISDLKIDIIFNALHGRDGEDGNAQSYFEYLKIPYTHSGVLASMNAMDKSISKIIFKKKKILTPLHFIIKSFDYRKNILREYIKTKKLKFPIVVKPTNEGSSIGVHICKNINNLDNTTKMLFKKYDNLIFENFIAGQEVQVALMNGKAIGAIELKPKRSFYDYKAKYLKSAKTSHIIPANITKKNSAKVFKISEKAHKSLNCRGVTRCDFKFFKNKFYLLEINTQPGMTNLSLVPEIAKHNGISFDMLINNIILDASINK